MTKLSQISEDIDTAAERTARAEYQKAMDELTTAQSKDTANTETNKLEAEKKKLDQENERRKAHVKGELQRNLKKLDIEQNKASDADEVSDGALSNINTALLKVNDALGQLDSI